MRKIAKRIARVSSSFKRTIKFFVNLEIHLLSLLSVRVQATPGSQLFRSS